MSFILDALRKAERDKQRGTRPNMHDVTHTPPAPVSATANRAPWVLIAIVLGLLALVIWLIPGTHQRLQPSSPGLAPASTPDPERSDFPAPTAAQSTAAEDARSTSAIQALPMAVHEGQRLPGTPAVIMAVASEDEPIEAQSFDELMDEPEHASEAEPSVALDPSRKARIRDADSGPATATPPTMPAPVPTSRRTPSAPSKNVSADSGPKPLRDMPDSYRASFPDIRVDVHVYNDDPARRWVLIGGKRYAEGQALASGASLDQIVSEGVVVGFRNESILLRVGQ